MSSAGTTLMIPDCELASMRTSDAFYLKQTVYTFAVPCLVGLVVCSWSAIVVVSVWWDRYRSIYCLWCICCGRVGRVGFVGLVFGLVVGLVIGIVTFIGLVGFVFTCLTYFTDLTFSLLCLTCLTFDHSFTPFAGTVVVRSVRCNSKRAKSKIT
jgi:hypothetical protein